MLAYNHRLLFFISTACIHLCFNIFIIFIYKTLITQKSFHLSKYDKIIKFYNLISSCIYMTSLITANSYYSEQILIYMLQISIHAAFNIYCFFKAKQLNRIINIRLGAIYFFIFIILSLILLRQHLYFESDNENIEIMLYFTLFCQQMVYNISLLLICIKRFEKVYEKYYTLLSLKKINLLNQQDLTCPICIEPLEQNDNKIIVKTICNHYFHLDCIESYMDVLYNNQNSMVSSDVNVHCPMCRTLIF